MPLDRGLIDQQLQMLGEGSRWWDERELRDLPAVLNANEHILAVSRGKVARLRWLRRTWLMVVTDRRLICMRSGSRSGWRQFEVDGALISRVAHRIGPVRGRILVTANGQKYRLSVPKEDAYKLHGALSGLGATGRETVTGFGPTRMVRRVVDHMLSLPAVALEPAKPAPKVLPSRPPGERDEAALRRLDLLEEQVQELHKQVDFLEQLLRQRHPDAPVGPARSPDR